MIICKRSLTADEIYLLQSIFSDSIDYNKVKIFALPIGSLKTAISLGGNIYFPKSYFSFDFSRENSSMQRWFIHEMVHVWQSQRGFPVLLSGIFIFFCGGYIFHRAYQYTHKIQAHTSFNQLNMEQQAEVIADFFTTQNLHLKQQLYAVMLDFIKSAHRGNVLPRLFV